MASVKISKKSNIVSHSFISEQKISKKSSIVPNSFISKYKNFKKNKMSLEIVEIIVRNESNKMISLTLLNETSIKIQQKIKNEIILNPGQTTNILCSDGGWLVSSLNNMKLDILIGEINTISELNIENFDKNHDAKFEIIYDNILHNVKITNKNLL